MTGGTLVFILALLVVLVAGSALFSAIETAFFSLQAHHIERLKARLREMLSEQMDVATQDAFSFDGKRCDRIVRTVLARVEALVHPDVLAPRT